MPRDTQQHTESDSAVNRRDVLKTAAGATVAGSLGTLSTGTVSAAASMDAAFLTDDCDLNLYQHHDQAEYSATDNTTFHIYQAVDTGGDSTTYDGTDGDAYAVAYDHDTGNVIGPHRIGMNPLNAEDTHGVPSMTIDGDGYIHVFFGNHGGWNTKLTGPGDDKIQYSRSQNPYDITSWIYPPDGSSGAGPLPTPRGTYTCATYDSNTDSVYVLYRADNGSGGYPSHDHATLARSSDNGNSWTDVNNGVLDFTDSPWGHTDAYVSDLGAWAGRIHLTWTVAESDSHGQPRKHIYHAAYNPSTGNMETMSGKDLGSEVSWANASNDCRIKNTGNTLISGDSTRTFNHAYDPASDTAYIPARYPVDSSTTQLRLLSYQGVSTRSGTWQESGQITTTSNPGRPSAEVRVNDSGQVEITDQGGKNGLWRRENGTWNHYDYVAGTPEIDKIQRPVQNGTDEFGWFGRTIQSDSEGDAWRSVYALGFGQPSGAGATPTRAPKNLRVTSEGSDTATIDWDDGIAGPSGVSKYKVYVDGVHQKDVTTQPSGQPYPRTWTTITFGGGTADVEVCLVNGNGTESATSNTVTVGDGSSQSPYGGTPWSIPGQIQAEDYDEGGQGVAYNDSNTTNSGGQYRSDGVDIETTQDSQGSAYNVGYVNPDEWLEFTCDVDSTGTYDLDLRVARNPTGSSSMHVEVDGSDVTGTVTVPNTGGWQTWQTVTVTDISLSAGQHVVRVYFDGDGINLNFMEWSQVSTSSGLEVNVNGSTQTFAESEISGYSGAQDVGTASVEEGGDALRLADNAWKSIPLSYDVTPDTVIQVELETPDEGEVVGVGFDNDGDHTNQFNGSYTVFQLAGSESWSDMIDVKSAYSSPGPQTVSIDVGSYYTGSADRLAFVADDDADASGEAVFRNVTIYEDSGQSPYGGTPHAIPGKIEAEHYDEGGEGVAYHDTTAGQEGSSTFRSDEDVDISDSGSGHAIGWIADGEWQEYTVDVASAGTYDLDLRVASNSSGGATIHIEFDGTDETGAISLPNTGGWHTYQTVTVTGINLDAGQQVMRVFVDDPSYNLDWLDWY